LTKLTHCLRPGNDSAMIRRVSNSRCYYCCYYYSSVQDGREN